MPAHKDHYDEGLDQSNPSLPDLSDEDSKVLKLGVAAFRRISKGAHREDWLNIGHSLNALQAAAMAAAQTNQPIGVVYNRYYAHFARKHHADGMANLEKSVRSHCMWMAREWTVVKTWLDGLPEKHRLKLNHPVSIHRSFDRATNPRDPLAVKETPYAENVRLRDEIDFLRTDRDELLKDGQHLFPPGTSAEERARLIVAELTPDEIVALARALHAWVENYQPHPDAPDDNEASEPLSAVEEQQPPEQSGRDAEDAAFFSRLTTLGRPLTKAEERQAARELDRLKE